MTNELPKDNELSNTSELSDAELEQVSGRGAEPALTGSEMGDLRKSLKHSALLDSLE